MNKKLVLLFGIIFVMLFSAKAFADPTVVTACGDLNSDGTYVLDSDFSYGLSDAPSAWYCFGINANVVFDCQGHKILNTDNAIYEVFQNNAYDNEFELRNCTIENGENAYFDGGSANINFHDLLINHTWDFAISATGSNILTNVNFTRIAYMPISIQPPSYYDCPYNFTNVNDIDTGLPIALYNSSVNLSNQEFAELILCDAPNSNLDNITVRMNVLNPLAYSNNSNAYFPYVIRGTQFIAYGSDNLTVSNSRFDNIYVIQILPNQMHATFVNDNVTNWFGYPFAGGFSGASVYCSNYNFTGILVDGTPMVYAHDGSYDITGNHSAVYLCNASNSYLHDLFSTYVSIYASNNVLIDRLYMDDSSLNHFSQFRPSYSSNLTLQNSFLSNQIWAFTGRASGGAVMNSTLRSTSTARNFEDSDFNSPVVCGTCNFQFYNDIVDSSGIYYMYGNTFVLNDSNGGNYWTNITGNGFSDICADSNHDGFCDSQFDLPNGWGSDYMPLSIMPSLSMPCVSDACIGSRPAVCVSNSFVVGDACEFGCSDGACNSAPPIPPVPLTGAGAVISDIGSGLGNFLSTIYLPLGNLILVLGIIAGVVAIFMGVAYVIKGALNR